MGTGSPDPSVNRFDMGADPVAWVRSRFELADELIPNVLEWSIQDGEARYLARNAFNTLLFEKGRNFEYLGRIVGGQNFHRDHKGDANGRPAFVPLGADVQRKALALLGDTLFNDKFFTFEPDLLNNLPPSRWWHWGTEPSTRIDYPIHEMVSMLQWWTLVDLCSPDVLQRIYDGELKSNSGDRFSAAEHIRTTRDLIWKRLDTAPTGSYTDAAPYVSSLSRGLQREYIDLMSIYLQTGSGLLVSADVQSMIQFGLRELSDRIARTLKAAETPSAGSKLDFASRAHLTECQSRLQRMLEAEFAAR